MGHGFDANRENKTLVVKSVQRNFGFRHQKYPMILRLKEVHGGTDYTSLEKTRFPGFVSHRMFDKGFRYSLILLDFDAGLSNVRITFGSEAHEFGHNDSSIFIFHLTDDLLVDE